MPIVHEAAGFRKFRLWVDRCRGFFVGLLCLGETH